MAAVRITLKHSAPPLTDRVGAFEATTTDGLGFMYMPAARAVPLYFVAPAESPGAHAYLIVDLTPVRRVDEDGSIEE